MGPLEGLTVVSLEQAIAAPFCTRQLADLGARVVKVERPGVGDFARQYDDKVRGLSSQFVWTNRGKESLTLDLKQPLARGVLLRLLAKADVFVQNLSPGATARLGLGAEELRQRYPSLIVCDISGYGDEGPYRHRKAYDLLVQCEAGLLAVTGTPEEPVKVGISVADIAAGMYALTGILTALYHRSHTGQGAALRVSLLDALAEWMSYPIYYAAYGGSPPARTGAHHATISPYGPFLARDGERIFVAVQNEREWQRFCREVLEDAELANDPRYQGNPARVSRRKEVESLVGSVFARLTFAELVARLERAQIAYARLNEVDEVFSHPQLRARGRFQPVTTPAGEVDMLLPPVISDAWTSELGSVPALGADTDRILAELGYAREEIAHLHHLGAV